jgi:hypothetical protein
MDPLEPIWGRLMTDCRALAGSERPTPRAVGSAGHHGAREHLVKRLGELSLVPAFGTDCVLPYPDRFANIVARLPRDGPRAPRAKTVLLGAHYDTCGETPGADDNAVAVAIVLETAQRLRRTPIARDVIVALFDAEEPPYFLGEAMDSTRLLVDVMLPAREPVFPIVLDLCGHDVGLPGLEPALFVVGLETDVHAQTAFERTGAPKNLVPLPIPNLILGGDFSDYHAFNERGLPYVFFTCGEWEHYHMRTDTVDKLSPSKMARIALHLEAFVRKLDDELRGEDEPVGANRNAKPISEPPDGSVSRATERSRFEALEPWFAGRLEPLLSAAGFPLSDNLETDLRRLRQRLA